VPKIQVTPSECPSGWHEAQADQASSEALPRAASGSILRTCVPNRPPSGTPKAVWNTSLPSATA
jgi:hypothetical protein